MSSNYITQEKCGVGTIESCAFQHEGQKDINNTKENNTLKGGTSWFERTPTTELIQVHTESIHWFRNKKCRTPPAKLLII